MTDTKTPALAEATLVFNHRRPMLTANQRMSWQQKARVTRVVRNLASFKSREAKLHQLGRCRVTLTWFVATRARRDADNIVPTLKAMCDGLVDAEVVVDDVPALMDKVMPRIVYELGGLPRLELLVEQLPSLTVLSADRSPT